MSRILVVPLSPHPMSFLELSQTVTAAVDDSGEYVDPFDNAKGAGFRMTIGGTKLRNQTCLAAPSLSAVASISRHL